MERARVEGERLRASLPPLNLPPTGDEFLDNSAIWHEICFLSDSKNDLLMGIGGMEYHLPGRLLDFVDVGWALVLERLIVTSMERLEKPIGTRHDRDGTAEILRETADVFLAEWLRQRPTELWPVFLRLLRLSGTREFALDALMTYGDNYPALDGMESEVRRLIDDLPSMSDQESSYLVSVVSVLKLPCSPDLRQQIRDTMPADRPLASREMQFM